MGRMTEDMVRVIECLENIWRDGEAKDQVTGRDCVLSLSEKLQTEEKLHRKHTMKSEGKERQSYNIYIKDLNCHHMQRIL